MQKMLVVILLLPVALLDASPATSALVGDVRVDLRHVDAGKPFSKLELIRRAVQRSKARAAALSLVRNSGSSDERTPPALPVHPSGDLEYVVDLAIGTPPKTVSALLDTGSDLIWTQCSPCTRCIPQPDPMFAPAQSSSYKPMPCSGELCTAILHHSCQRSTCAYRYSYGDGTMSLGVYGTENFTFTSQSGEAASFPLGFGCGVVNVGSLNNGSGIVGFGREALSLVAQLSIRRFSYCLTPYTSKRKSTLQFGSLADVYDYADGPVQTTMLLRSPQYPTFYYVAFTGITVGARRLRIPESAFSLKTDGSGGVIIDSGTALTLFPTTVHAEVVRAFRAQLRLPFANDGDQDSGVCFVAPAGRHPSRVRVPRMVFHFRGADLNLPRRNYILDERSKGHVCLLLADSGDDGSTIGNFVQQDMGVLYDLEKETLSFAPLSQC